VSSPYGALISKWFSIDTRRRLPTASSPHLDPPAAGEIVLVTGPSGSGKSTLLRRFRRRCKEKMIDVARIALGRSAVIDHFRHISIESALAHLSRVGLAEAHCYLLPPRYLSDGQRWRLRLALALSYDSDAARCLLCDEFASLLDPITASVVARVLRRAVTGESNLGAVVASCRSDIVRALAPDLMVRCDFGTVQCWRKEKGGSYVNCGETSAAPGFCSRSADAQKRQPAGLQSP